MFWICNENTVYKHTGILVATEQCWTEPGTFLFLTSPRWMAQSTEGAGRGHGEKLWHRDMTKGYFTLCDIMLNNKTGEKKRKGRMFGVMIFVFPRNHYTWQALLSWKWLTICRTTGSSEWIPCFALHAHITFALTGKLSLDQLMSCHSFTFPPSPPPHLARVNVCVMLLSCLLELNHNSNKSEHYIII